jgi:predicted esterase
METDSISFNYRAPYYKRGVINDSTREVWIVLHGYGQLARFFLRKFEKLVQQNICVIAPEGLSHFYLEETQSRIRTGNMRVGASWMTRENRLNDIDNYLSYLQAVYAREIGDYNLPVTILGFSQGAATASRWIADGRINFSRLILWAGVFPPDMNFERGKTVLQGKETLFIYGDRDPFLKDNTFTEFKTLSETLGISPRYIVFEGEHDIDEKTLLQLL